MRHKKQKKQKFDYQVIVEQGDSLIKILEELNAYHPVFKGSIENLKHINHLLKEQLEETRESYPELFN